MSELRTQNDIDFDNLPHPEDVLQELGEFALVGMYCAVSKAFMTISETVTAGILRNPPLPRGVIEREGMFEAWLDDCGNYLPEWYSEYDEIHNRWIRGDNLL